MKNLKYIGFNHPGVTNVKSLADGIPKLDNGSKIEFRSLDENERIKKSSKVRSMHVRQGAKPERMDNIHIDINWRQIVS